jgi:phosphatidate phosphatase PAH1
MPQSRIYRINLRDSITGALSSLSSSDEISTLDANQHVHPPLRRALTRRKITTSRTAASPIRPFRK